MPTCPTRARLRARYRLFAGAAVTVLLTTLLAPAAAQAAARRAPTAPTFTSVARHASGGFQLAWQPVSGATGYTVYVRVPVGATSDGRYTITGWEWSRVAAVGNTTTYRTPDGLWTHVPNGYGSPLFAVTATNRAGSSPLSGYLGAGCAPAYFVAARGSGNNPTTSGDNGYNQGLSTPGKAIYEDTRTRLGYSRSLYQPVAVNYPADDVSFDSVTQYNRSKNAGRDTTVGIINGLNRYCPAAKVVLFGYSQGAHVVGDAFARLGSTQKKQVTRLVLFSDPARNENDPNVVYKPTNHRSGGIMKDRADFTGTTDKAQTESWCWKRDMVCTAGSRFHGPAYTCYAQWVAHSVAVRARQVRWVPAANVTEPGCTPAP